MSMNRVLGAFKTQLNNKAIGKNKDEEKQPLITEEFLHELDDAESFTSFREQTTVSNDNNKKETIEEAIENYHLTLKIVNTADNLILAIDKAIHDKLTSTKRKDNIFLSIAVISSFFTVTGFAALAYIGTVDPVGKRALDKYNHTEIKDTNKTCHDILPTNDICNGSYDHLQPLIRLCAAKLEEGCDKANHLNASIIQSIIIVCVALAMITGISLSMAKPKNTELDDLKKAAKAFLEKFGEEEIDSKESLNSLKEKLATLKISYQNKMTKTQQEEISSPTPPSAEKIIKFSSIYSANDNDLNTKLTEMLDQRASRMLTKKL